MHAMTSPPSASHPGRKAWILALFLIGTLCMLVFLPIFLCGGLIIKMDGVDPLQLLVWMVASGTVGGASLASALRLSLADPET